MTIPLITQQQIINYCGPNMYEFGKDFLSLNPFFVYYREWTVIKGICEGSMTPSYCVRILFDEHGIANSCCTCYTNRIVPCKHIAALLLMWHQQPGGVPDRPQWGRMLQTKNKGELIELLEKMVDLYPESFVGCDPCMIQPTGDQ